MMQILFICLGNVDYCIKLFFIDLIGNELLYNLVVKGDQNVVGGVFNFLDKII